MSMDEQQDKNDTRARDAANIRLAVGLGLFAFALYAGYILKHVLD